MDPALVTKIQQDVAAALKDPAVLYLKKTGALPVGSTPAAFDAYMRAEAEKWGCSRPPTSSCSDDCWKVASAGGPARST